MVGRCAISTPHHLATHAGVEAVRRGGNAVDAALAAAAALTVVYPHNTALGGDVIALLRRPDGRIYCVNGSGPAPQGVSASVLRAKYGSRMPVTGVDTVTVPGVVAGWDALHRLGAALAWSDHFDRAVTFADEGVPVAPSLAAAVQAHAENIENDRGLARIFSPGGRLLTTGDDLHQPALAATLRELRATGPAALYGGDVGLALTRSLQGLGSAMSLEDLAEYVVEICDPLVGDFGDYRVWTSPLNTQGFLLLEILGAISATHPTPDLLGRNGDVLARLFHEAVQDRERLIGDPRFGAPSLAGVLNGEYFSVMADRALNAAMWTSHVGERSASSAPASGDAVAVVAADDDGYAACIIQSVFHAFGAFILDPDTGILMHNRGAFFSLDEASPNALGPGRRPGSTLMPVMVTTAEGNLSWVAGTMGGKGQPQIHTQVLLRLFQGATPSQAVSAPRWIVGGLAVGQNETTVHIEADVPTQTVDAITRSGMDIQVLPSHSESTGHAQIVELQAHRVVAAASDPRADGTGQLCDLGR